MELKLSYIKLSLIELKFSGIKKILITARYIVRREKIDLKIIVKSIFKMLFEILFLIVLFFLYFYAVKFIF